MPEPTSKPTPGDMRLMMLLSLDTAQSDARYIELMAQEIIGNNALRPYLIGAAKDLRRNAEVLHRSLSLYDLVERDT